MALTQRLPRLCHYCYQAADTRDHIVPRSEVVHSPVEGVTNTVPCCAKCNQRKGNQRSTCDCEVCVRAGQVYGPDDWSIRERVDPAVGKSGFSRRTGKLVAGSMVRWRYDSGR